jgi:hypothetical protein
MMIGYKIECIVNYLFFLIIEKRIYYLWTKYGQNMDKIWTKYGQNMNKI